MTTPVVVQAVWGGSTGGGRSSDVATITGVTAGNTIIAICYVSGGFGSITGVADTNGAFSQNGTTHFDDGGTPIIQSGCFYRLIPNGQGGSVTVTATYSSGAQYAGNGQGLLLVEVTNLQTLATPADGFPAPHRMDSPTADGAGALVSNAITTTAPGDLLLGLLVDRTYQIGTTAGTGSWVTQAVSGWDNTSSFRLLKQVQTNAGSINVTATVGTTGHNWLTIMAAFKQSASIPTITQQPTNATVAAGSAASFSVTATASAGTLHYEWKKNGVAILGNDSATYTTDTNYGSNNGDTYQVVIYDDNGNNPSNVVTLTVNAIPTISGSIGSVNEGGSYIITGTTFGSTRGTGTVTLNGTSQTVTAWGDTSITCTHVLGTDIFGYQTCSLIVNTNSSGPSTTNTSAIGGIFPATGYSYVNVASLASTGLLQAVPSLQVGDQIEYDDQYERVTVFVDGSFSVDPIVTSFQFRVGSAGNGYGAWATQTIQGSSGQIITPTIGAIVIAGQNASLPSQVVVTPFVGSVSIVGQAPTLVRIGVVQVNVGSVSLTGRQVVVENSTPVVGVSYEITPTTGFLQILTRTNKLLSARERIVGNQQIWDTTFFYNGDIIEVIMYKNRKTNTFTGTIVRKG